jgi:hypothetical protein
MRTGFRLRGISIGLFLCAASCGESDMDRARANNMKHEADQHARRDRSEGKTVYVHAGGPLLPNAPIEGRDQGGWFAFHARSDCPNYQVSRRYYRFVEATMRNRVPIDAGGKPHPAPTPCWNCTN